jgi:peroxiredoxin
LPCWKSGTSQNKKQFNRCHSKQFRMKNFFLLLLLPVLALNRTAAQSIAPSKGFVLTGAVQNLGDADVKILNGRGDQTVAEGKAKAGVFSVSGAVPEPGLYLLQLGKEQPHPLFLENTAIKVSGSKADLKNLKIEGSASQKEFALFEQTFTPLFKNLNTVVTQINNAPDAKKAALMNQYNEALRGIQNEIVKFITPRKSSYVSLFVVSVTMQAAENIADVEKSYPLLSDGLKNSAQGKEVASYISYAKVGAVGTDALDFTQNDVNDKPITLSSFKGKYVLVDFWASWCRPCRAENPNVVKIFNRFKDKNFTVLGVSLDQQKEAWVQAIAKDKLTWTHVSDLQFWNNAAAQLYRVQSIPQNFLIDPAGKIVAKDLRGEDLEKKLCEYLGCSN